MKVVQIINTLVLDLFGFTVKHTNESSTAADFKIHKS